jgi:hypothetical protein
MEKHTSKENSSSALESPGFNVGHSRAFFMKAFAITSVSPYLSSSCKTNKQTIRFEHFVKFVEDEAKKVNDLTYGSSAIGIKRFSFLYS